MLKSIAALTMVRNGGDFLRRWVDYYGHALGKDNLFILFDGEDQIPPAFTAGCNVTVCKRTEGNVAEADRGRAAILSGLARDLLGRYGLVIGTDVDEFIVPDPAPGLSLAEYLSGIEARGRKAFSPLGCDVVQNVGCEGPLSEDLPILSQRSFALLSTRYTKASILCAPADWGSGFHRVRGSSVHILKDLYLFHFGCADASDILSKLADGDLSSRGWNRHLAKRRRLFDAVPHLPVREWDTWTSRARRIQTSVHPPYAWNKPAMLGLRILVRIPDRFRSIV